MNRNWVNGEPVMTAEEMRDALDEILVDATAARFGVPPGQVTDEMIRVHMEMEDEELRAMAKAEGWL